MYDKLPSKVNSIKVSSTSRLVSKTQYNFDKKNLVKKIENVYKTSGLVKMTGLWKILI